MAVVDTRGLRLAVGVHLGLFCGACLHGRGRAGLVVVVGLTGVLLLPRGHLVVVFVETGASKDVFYNLTKDIWG